MAGLVAHEARDGRFHDACVLCPPPPPRALAASPRAWADEDARRRSAGVAARTVVRLLEDLGLAPLDPGHAQLLLERCHPPLARDEAAARAGRVPVAAVCALLG